MKKDIQFRAILPVLLLVAVFSVVSACGQQQESPTATPLPPVATNVVAPTNTPSPTADLPASVEPTLTQTLEPVASDTAEITQAVVEPTLTLQAPPTKSGGLAVKPTRTPRYRPTDQNTAVAVTKLAPKGSKSSTPTVTPEVSATPESTLTQENPGTATRTPEPTFTYAPTFTPMPTYTETPTAIPPAVTRIVSATSTPLSTATKGPSSTPTSQPPTSTPLPTITPTSTPLPTPTPLSVPRYAINMLMNYKNMNLDVQQEIRFSNLGTTPIKDMLLSVQPNRISKVFELVELRYNDELITEYDLVDQRLEWKLSSPLTPGQTARINMRYRIYPPRIEQGDPNVIRPQIFGVTPRQVNLTDWYPMLVPYQEPGGWLLHNPWQFGEHLVYPLADYDVTLRFTDPFNVPVIAASGTLQSDIPIMDGRHYRLENGRDFVFSMGLTMKVLSAQVENITVKSYFFPGSEIAGKAVLDTTVQAVKTYTSLFGSYSHKTLSAVQGDFNDGMEFDGLYYLSKPFYDLYDGSVNNYLVMIAAHETSHQWWFGRVANDQNNQPWLDESLATYCEKLFYEYNYPDSVDWWWDYRINFYQPKGFINGSVPSYKGLTSYTDATYRLGAQFLEDLRQKTGDKVFLEFMKDYSTKMNGKIASSDDFFSILRLHTKVNIAPLITQYFSE